MNRLMSKLLIGIFVPALSAGVALAQAPTWTNERSINQLSRTRLPFRRQSERDVRRHPAGNHRGGRQLRQHGVAEVGAADPVQGSP